MSAEIFDVTPITIQTMPAWGGAWITRDEFEPIDASIDVQEGNFLRFRHRYGDLESVGGHPLASGAPLLGIDRHWLRALDVNGNVFFQGRVEKETRQIHSNPDGQIPSGVQTFFATGGTRILHRLSFHRSLFYTPGYKHSAASVVNDNYQVIQWLPNFNSFDENGLIVGNRTAERHTVSTSGQTAYLFGESEKWSALDMAEYIVAWVLNSNNEDDPLWRLTGDLVTLGNIVETIETEEIETAYSLLSKVISNRFGVGFQVIPENTGFRIEVFNLLVEPISFAGQTIPANQNVIQVDANSAADAQSILLEADFSETYDVIRVVGNRMVWCGSMRFQIPNDVFTIRARRGWNSALEWAPFGYNRAIGDDADVNDQHRRKPVFAEVYTNYILHLDEEYNTSDWPLGYMPGIDNQGEIDLGSRGPLQYTARSTLEGLPMVYGVDYTKPQTDDDELNNLLIRSHQPAQAQFTNLDLPNRVLSQYASEVNTHITVLPNQVGVQFVPPINHYIAKGFFDPNDDTEFAPSNIIVDVGVPISITIAFETDQRLEFTYTQSSFNAASLGIKELKVEAELWFLAPLTSVGIDEEGSQELSPDTGQTLRNDRERLLTSMAGAVARYGQPRSRGSITVKNFINWTDNIGKIVEVINDGSDANTIKGPLTAIDWNFEPTYQTTLRIGYARRQ